MIKSILTVSLIVCTALSCSKDRHAEHYTLQLSKLRNAYINTRTEVFTELKSSIETLSTSVSAFYYQTNQLNLDACKGRYMDCRYSVQLAMLFNRTNGSLTVPNQIALNRFENFPINPGYVDYYSDGSIGIINDTPNYPTLSEGEIKNWNLVNGATNHSCGLHVIEFLLFGEDQSMTLSGNRPLSDFNNLRRRQYLLYTSNILRADVNAMLDQTNFNNAIKAQNLNESFEFIFDGLLDYIKTDFATNTLKKCLVAQNDYNEVDRFSDYTMLELKHKVQAIRVFLNPKAYFTGAGDYFLATFIQEEDPSLADFIYSSLNQLDAHFDAVNMSFEEALVDASASQELSSAYAVLYELHAKLVNFKKKVLKDY